MSSRFGYVLYSAYALWERVVLIAWLSYSRGASWEENEEDGPYMCVIRRMQVCLLVCPHASPVQPQAGRPPHQEAGEQETPPHQEVQETPPHQEVQETPPHQEVIHHNSSKGGEAPQLSLSLSAILDREGKGERKVMRGKRERSMPLLFVHDLELYIII